MEGEPVEVAWVRFAYYAIQIKMIVENIMTQVIKNPKPTIFTMFWRERKDDIHRDESY